MNNDRISELDGLRGLAAILVVLYHYTSRFSLKFDNEILSDIQIFKYGHYGVQLFFVISGFVIFMSINKVKSPFEFIYKRFIRLFPTYWLCIILTFLIVTIMGPPQLIVGIVDFIGNFSMIPRVFNLRFVDGVYWTLQIELCFYLFMLGLLLIDANKYVTQIGVFYILCGFLLYFLYKIHPYYHYGLLFFAGIQFYKLWRGDLKWYRHLLILMIVLISFLYKGLELGICIALIMCIFYLLINRLLKILSLPFFVTLGAISYPFYLIHQNIGHSIQLLMIENEIKDKFLLISVPFVITICISYLITFLYEKNVLMILSDIYTRKFKLSNKVVSPDSL